MSGIDTGKTPDAGVAVPPRDVATIKLRGGRLALDFLNTVIDDPISGHYDDTLHTAGDLRRWGVRMGLVRRTATIGDGDLSQAVALRGLLCDVFAATTQRCAPADDDRRALAHAVACAYAAGEVVASKDGSLAWRWDEAVLGTVRHRIAIDAVRILTSDAAPRVGRCVNPACRWFFFDASKNHSKRWCSMEGCGNDAKAARRRRR